MEPHAASSALRRVRLLAFWGLLFLALFPLSLARATPGLAPTNQPELSLELYGDLTQIAGGWGSESEAVLTGKTLLMPLGSMGLILYDMTDPRNPQLQHWLSAFELGGQPGMIAVKETRAFIALPDTQRLAVLDISDPARPRVLGRVSFSIPSIQQVQLRGDVLYIYGVSSFEHPGGVYAYDVRPTLPTFLGSYLVDLTDVGFYVSESHIAFVSRSPEHADDVPRLDIVDMRDPTTPVRLSQWAAPLQGNIWDMDMVGHDLYIAAYWGGIWHLNASDLVNVRWVEAYDWETREFFARSIRVLPPFVLVARAGGGEEGYAYDIFRSSSNGITLDRSIGSKRYPLSVYGDSDLLILEQWELDQQDKGLRFYRATVEYKQYLPLAR